MVTKLYSWSSFVCCTQWIWLGLCLSFIACNNTSTQQDQQQQEQKPSLVLIDTPAFHADSAYRYIEEQVAMGPRVPGSAAHQACAQYLYNRLQAFGWQTQIQAFEAQAYDGKPLLGRNIIGSYRPDIQRRILLMAHWDTRAFADKDPDSSNWHKPIPGANDGASGVAVLLEIARLLALHQPYIGVDIIFFDLEDNGPPEFKTFEGNESQYWCLGSQYWSKNPHQPGYRAYYGILLDMVGAHDARFYKEPYSLEFAPQIVEKVWQTARLMGYEQYFINQKAPIRFGGILDDHFFVNRDAKIPSIDIIDYEHGFRSYHHTLQDDLPIIDINTLKAVGDVLLQVLYQEAAHLQP